MSKIGVTGYKGRVGSELVRRGLEPIELNMKDVSSIRRAVKGFDVIFHCAAYTNVDGAESPPGYSESTLVNDIGTQFLCECFTGRIIYISTDYIFDGKHGPYSESATPNPINHYGVTKLHGEQHILDRQEPFDTIVRTTILYDKDVGNFVTSLYLKLYAGMSLQVPLDLIGNPTYVPHFVNALLELLTIDKPPKIINISGLDLISRYDFALMIANAFGRDVSKLVPVTHVVQGALRPKKAGFKLNLAKKLKLPLYHAIDGLEDLRLHFNKDYL